MASKVRSKAAPVTLPARDWSFWLILSGALLAALIVFGPALNGSFVFDDYHLPFADPNAAHQPARFWIGGVRPLLIATYWANFLISGTSTFTYHLVNVLFHAATAAIVFLIFRRLLKLADPSQDRRWYALFGAALFLLHPLQTESVDYLAGRSELISGFFFFAAWLVFLNRFESETSVWTSVEILLLAGAAVLGKESAISLPAVLVATDLFWARTSFAAGFRRRWKLYVPFVLGAIAAALLILRSLTAAGAAGFSSGITPFEYALTQCRVIWIYLRLFLIPVGQNGDWQLPFYRSLGEGAAAVWVLAMGVLIAAVVLLFRRARLAAFGLLVFLLTLAPTSSFVPIKDALAERRMYIPIAGAIIVTLAVVMRFASRVSPAVLRWAAVGVLGLFSVASFVRSEIWTSDFAFWKDTSERNPANSRAHFGFGSGLAQRRDYAGAIREFKIARSQDPHNTEVLWNLASAYQLNHQVDLALPLFRTFAALEPTPQAYDRVGYLEAQAGDATAALDSFEQALRLNPEDASSLAYRGTLKLGLNDFAEAEADFRRALAIDPGNQIALTGMAGLPGSGQ